MPLRAAPGRICSTEHLLYDKQSIPCSQVPHRPPGETTAVHVYLKHKTGRSKYYVRRSQKELRMEGKGREKRREEHSHRRKFHARSRHGPETWRMNNCLRYSVEDQGVDIMNKE